MGLVAEWLVGWVAGWLAGWLPGCLLARCLAGRLAGGWLAEWLAGWLDGWPGFFSNAIRCGMCWMQFLPPCRSGTSAASQPSSSQLVAICTIPADLGRSRMFAVCLQRIRPAQSTIFQICFGWVLSPTVFCIFTDESIQTRPRPIF